MLQTAANRETADSATLFVGNSQDYFAKLL
jgi:hypothetical protein